MVGVGWHVRYGVTVTLLGNASTMQGKAHKTPAAAIAKTLRFGLQITTFRCGMDGCAAHHELAS
jgi:hypothetical protein